MIDFPEQRRRVEQSWGRWSWLLDGWDITLRFSEGSFGLINGKSSCGEIIAEARANWRYLNGAVRWDLAAVSDISDAELEETTVHEMVHFLVNEMNSPTGEDESNRSDHEERAVTVLSRLILQQRRRVLAAAFFTP